MADDLDSFFAKKKATKKKGKVAQDTDDLAKRLEKAVRQQELIDRDREEDERRERAQSDTQHAENEDSEWLEAHEPQDVELTSKLQELDIEEINAQDEDAVDDETHEKPKTWNVAADGSAVSEDNKPTPDDEEVIEVPKQPEAHKKYVAPGARHMLQSRGDRQPDLQNVEEFPSLAAADELSKVEIEKKKKTAQRSKEYNENQQKLNQDRQDKESTPTTDTNPNPWRRQERYSKELPTTTADSIPPHKESETVSHAQKPGSYVPPSRRADYTQPKEYEPPTKSGSNPPPQKELPVEPSSVPHAPKQGAYIPPNMRGKV